MAGFIESLPPPLFVAEIFPSELLFELPLESSLRLPLEFPFEFPFKLPFELQLELLLLPLLLLVFPPSGDEARDALADADAEPARDEDRRLSLCGVKIELSEEKYRSFREGWHVGA